MTTSTAPKLKRDKNGRILPGQASLNPGGRPKKGERVADTLEAKLDNALHHASQLTPGEIKVLSDYQKEAAHDPSKTNAKRTRVATASTIRKRILSQIDDVVDRLVADALKGDTASAKLLLERVSPQLKAFEHVGLDINTLPRMVVVPPTADKDTKDNIIDAEVVESKEYKASPPTAEMNEKHGE